MAPFVVMGTGKDPERDDLLAPKGRSSHAEKVLTRRQILSNLSKRLT